MSDNAEFPENNGAILNIAQIIKNVVTSAADAEINALFINTRHAIPARNLLNEMGHKQPATPAQTDNTTALQLDWPSMSTWAYAGIWAADVRFQFRVQIQNPDEKLHKGLLLDF